MDYTALPCSALHCPLLHCSKLSFTSQHYLAPHWPSVNWSVTQFMLCSKLHWVGCRMVVYCTIWLCSVCCTVLYCPVVWRVVLEVPNTIASYRATLHHSTVCVVLHCKVLHYTVLYFSAMYVTASASMFVLCTARVCLVLFCCVLFCPLYLSYLIFCATLFQTDRHLWWTGLPNYDIWVWNWKSHYSLPSPLHWSLFFSS